MSDWKTLRSEVVYETPWLKVCRDEVLNHNNKPLVYSVVSLHYPSVFIVAINDKSEVLMQKNYRYTLDDTLWEIPAGHSDGEDLLTAAKRELREESGLEASKWTNLGTAYQAVGVANMPMTVFLAHNIYQATDERDEDEEISEQNFIPFNTIEGMIERGEITNSAAISALYKARLHLRLR